MRRLKQPDRDEAVVKTIKKICQSSHYTYGYRRVTQVLAQKDIIVNHKKVRKLMKIHGLSCTKFTHRGRKYRSFKGHVGKVAQNLLNRRFKTDRPFQKVVTDITEFKLNNSQKLYLSPFMDVYSLEILSFKVSSRPTLDIVTEPLHELLAMRPDVNYRCTIHSDQGWHYQNYKYVNFLKQHQMFQSMSRKGNCLDNALMENFFSLLKQ